MPSNGDYGKGSAGRGKSEEIFLPGSPDYRQMMDSRAYKKDMYDSMTPKATTPAKDPNGGIQGTSGGKTGDKSKATGDTAKAGNTYKKDYAKMSETMPKEVQVAPGKTGKKPVKSIKELRDRVKGKGM